MSKRRLRADASGWGFICIGLLPLLLLCTGCPLPAPSDGDGDITDTGDNSTLVRATPLNLSEAGDERRITGTLSGRSDIDVYGLGELSPGDRIVADVQRSSGNLDAVAAVFNSAAELIAYNDDRTPDSSNLNPLIDFVLPGATGSYYLALVSYPGGNTTGGYTVDVRVERGVGLDAPDGQVVFLNWAGGQNIVIANIGVFDLGPFSATDVGFSAALTGTLKDRVEAIVASRYAGFNLTLLNSDDVPVPATPHTTIYFGGRNFEAFAISEQIDGFNNDPSDDAIVFTSSYLDAFSHQPSLEEMAQALGNTVAHELGHLLGLVHTSDCDDLMDTTCANDRILVEQMLGTAELDDSVFPFGVQDAVDLVGWVLGY